MKYTEIFRLKKMLEEANIPFQFIDRTINYPELNIYREHYQICYPKFNSTEDMNKPAEFVCSCIEGRGTYGSDFDLLEIMGLLTDKELKYDSVAGGLTADDVFNRIKKHYCEVVGNTYDNPELLEGDDAKD